MIFEDSKVIVSTDWLYEHLHDHQVRVVDASWHLPGSARDARAEYNSRHIPGAHFFDIEEIRDRNSEFPHMIPSADQFASVICEMGINSRNRVVIYDCSGLFSAARVWWLFNLMGQENAAVLDGGLPKWTSEHRPTDDLPPVFTNCSSNICFQKTLVANVEQVLASVERRDYQIVDARSSDRFEGAVPEPRAGLRCGHIPGSKNIPFKTLLNHDQTLKNPSELAAIFRESGLDLDKPVITTCGSGITAAVLNLALSRIGRSNHALYDGSWA